jgi:uncharacterized membrane protein
MSAETIAATLVRGSIAEGIMHGAYLPALIVHTSASAIGLVSGAAALLFRKGERLHRMAGRAFAAAMLILGLSAVPIGETYVSFITGPLAAYFAATAWMSARRKNETSGLFEICALVFALGLSAIYFIFGAQAAMSPTGKFDGFPASFHYVFGSIAGLAALLDLHAILRRKLSEPARIARHLWRMCFALFSAATSFFLGQIDRFPEFIRDTGFNVAVAFAPLALMLFWLVRVRFMKRRAVPAFAAFPARIGGALYLTALAAGLFGLLLPRG